MTADRIVVHCIGNAHIDPVWRWRWQEGYTEVLATCRAAVDRMRDTPGFTMNRGQAATYAWIEEGDPALFGEIQQYVREGRWHVVNGWWEQPDANVPGGESYVRHALYGKRWFRDKLGVDVRVGWNVDTFGHNGGLPQILAKAGFRAYCFFRPGPHEKELPPFFWWQGPDGSRILGVRPPVGHYGTGGGDLKDHIRHAAERAGEMGMRHAILFFGVGNHGGGPTRENIASVQALHADPSEPDAVFSSVAAFLDAIGTEAADLPTVTGDLQHHAPGCYTTHSGIKAWNHDAEVRLNAAERWCALAASALGIPYPREEFESAWRPVLFNQFHDILAGTSLPAAYDDSREQIGAACAAAARLQNRALQALAAHVDTRLDDTEPPAAAEGHPVLLLNPSSWDRAEPVTVQWGWRSLPGGRLLDDQGRDVPFQDVQPDLFGGGKRIAFEADVPAGGWRTYRLVPGEPPGRDEHAPSAAGNLLGNSHYRLELDAAAGTLSRLYALDAQADLLAGPGCALVVMDDPGDTWGHDIPSWRDEAGRFGDARLTVVESGPARATLRAESRWGDSTARQEFTVYRACRRIDVTLTLDWREKHKFLKLSVPLGITDARLTCGIPYGALERGASGLEDPFQGWLDLSGQVTGSNGTRRSYGLSVLAPAKFGYDCLGADLRVSLLRSPVYCFHDPAKPEPGHEYLFMDQGQHVIRYALLPHAGDWREAGVPRHADAFAMPLEYVFQYPHAGDWGRAGSLLCIDRPNVIAVAAKGSEDGADLVVRLLETEGRAVEAHVVLPNGRSVDTSLGAWELQTLRIPTTGRARVVNLLEE